MSIESIEHLTTRALTVALDAGSLRHRVIAANIANVNTPGYVAQRVSFEALLGPGASASAATPELRASVEPVAGGQGLSSGVQLDAEVAAMSENSLHQQVLLRALQRHLGLLATAVTEGKR
jgi:flagellar basal-body rod protein FlgB